MSEMPATLLITLVVIASKTSTAHCPPVWSRTLPSIPSCGCSGPPLSPALTLPPPACLQALRGSAVGAGREGDDQKIGRPPTSSVRRVTSLRDAILLVSWLAAG